MGTMLDLLVFLYGVVAPGAAVGFAALHERPVFERLAVGAVVGLFVVPLLHFVVAIGLSTHVSRTLVVADATAVLVCAAAVMASRRRNT